MPTTLDPQNLDLRPYLQPNDLVIVAQLGAEPTALTAALFEASREVSGLRVLTSFPLGPPDGRLAAADRIEFISMDGFGANGKLFQAGKLGIAPARFSDYWRLFDAKLKPDVVLCSATPADAAGNVSLGVTVDHLPHVISRARAALVELNLGMPWTNGDAVLPLDAFTATVTAPAPPMEWTSRTPGPIDHAVAANVARLVPDRSTVQYGVGSLPDAVAAALTVKRDLGMHSGSFADSFVDLIEAGDRALWLPPAL
jgi:acyl-CoA hydrolase